MEQLITYLNDCELKWLPFGRKDHALMLLLSGQRAYTYLLPPSNYEEWTDYPAFKAKVEALGLECQRCRIGKNADTPILITCKESIAYRFISFETLQRIAREQLSGNKRKDLGLFFFAKEDRPKWELEPALLLTRYLQKTPSYQRRPFDQLLLRLLNGDSLSQVLHVDLGERLIG